MKKIRSTFKLTSFIKLILLHSLVLIFFISCNNGHINVAEKEIVAKPEEINKKAEEVILGTLKDILHDNKELSDSFKVQNADLVQFIYDQNSYQPIWTSQGAFTKYGDSLLLFIDSSKQYGLFPDDYYCNKLHVLRDQLISDTTHSEKKLDASLWSYTDMLFTSAFVNIVKDLKVGRLLPDSVIARDSTLKPEFYNQQLKLYQQSNNQDFAQQLEPTNTDYKKLKEALKGFLPKANFRSYTIINTKDSTQIPTLLYKRLSEEDSTLMPLTMPDSTDLAHAIKRYQKKHHLNADAKISTDLINRLNNTDKEKFIRIAITLDKYKQLPPLPTQYIWVNLPSYYLQLKDSDSVVIKSRVVIGKPTTKTPIITSAISNMITYPKWTIPESIIKKEILPGLKRDPGYTIKKGLSLVDDNGNEINPYTVNWSKYEKGIPYKVVQGSGDDNALGVLKFNFPNKYAVYLHDTNQRYLFSKSSRALSHGCVRVQAWKDLAEYILRNDSTYAVDAIPVDSLNNWLILKQKHVIPVRKPIPLFIRYFTCDVKDGHLIFYEDIYGEDRRIRESIFSDK